MLSEEIKTIRRSGIGGSDVAAIAGLSSYKTALGVYLDKRGLSEERDMTEAQRWGHIMEPVILTEYERKTSIKLIREPETLHSKQYPWMLANLDGISEDGAIIVDAKNIDAANKWQWGVPGTDDIPMYIHLQMAHYAIAANAHKVDVAVLFGKHDFKIYSYHRNASLEERIIKMEDKFWHEHVLPKIPPEVKSTEDARLLWREAIKESVKIADDKTLDVWNELKNIKDEIKKAKKKEEELKTILLSEIQDNERLVDASGFTLATWKNQPSRRFNQTRVEKYHPELFAYFKDEQITRPLRINFKEC